MAIAGRKEMTDTYDQVTNHALARLGAPYWTWSKEPSLDKEVQALKKGPLHGFRHFFVLLLAPSHDTFLNRVVASDANRDGVFIGLALELYHREHAKWPESLSELSPKYLPTLPADPITETVALQSRERSAEVRSRRVVRWRRSLFFDVRHIVAPSTPTRNNRPIVHDFVMQRFSRDRVGRQSWQILRRQFA